ncbi:MAG: Ubiquinone biosynthesis O-methyltransferase [Gemmatimonadaceae bacterium]|nr:Ubiquinone biosynthesis O-methyltransferase [Gemmatimonadaceae bacterium]
MQLSLRCPRCTAPLTDARPVCCATCGTEWPEVAGIVDWRFDQPDPYLTLEKDRAAAEALASRAASLDFPALLASYYDGNALVPAAQARAIVRGTLAAPARAAAFLDQSLGQLKRRLAPGSKVLDAGSGTGPLAVELARRGMDVIAVDIGMRWLTLAEARARAAGVRIAICCSGIHRLPIADAQVDAIMAESLLEVVPSQSAMLRELFRVLRPGGELALSTPNPWSPGPDPHTGVPFTSWLPPGGVNALARMRGIVPPRRTFVSRNTLRDLLANAGFADIRISPAEIPAGFAEGKPAWLKAGIVGYRLITTAPGLRAIAAVFGPVHVATARRPER